MAIEKIQELINKYNDYKDELVFEKEITRMIYEKCMAEKRMPSEFETKKIEFESKKFERDITDEKKEIEKELKAFSQEELVFMYENSNNESINRLIQDRIMKNNAKIVSINSYSETGAIFEMLLKTSDEDIKKVLGMRESKDPLLFNNKELDNFSLNSRSIIQQKLNGNLEEAKKIFCKEHNLSSELEFEFYKNNSSNQKIIKNANALQKSLNELLKIDNDSIIKKAQEDLLTTKPKHR